MARGFFNDLQFAGALRHKDKDKAGVQCAFDWKSDVLNYLENKNTTGCNTMLDKKHRLICCSFETSLGLCLYPLDNVLENPGCECFCGCWGVASEVDDSIVNNMEGCMQFISV